MSEDAKNMIVSSELNTPVSTEVSQASIEATPPTEANQQDNISSLHETNKKSLRWVVC